MKLRKRLLPLFILFFIGMCAFVSINPSYSYGLKMQISGTKGSRILTLKDADTGHTISYKDAITNYGLTNYLEIGDGYYYQGKEVDYSTFQKGFASEKADQLAKDYGSSAFRVHTTKEFKSAFDSIYQNYRIGQFYFCFSPYENIDFDEVESYYMQNYGLTSPYQNYYSYRIKGKLEPTRFAIGLKNYKEKGEFMIDTFNIRITGNELAVVDDFIRKILPLMQGDGSDYQKILAAYTYITKTTTYLTDNGFYNDLLASNTSIYDVFIGRKSVCIGYSIAFSYLMDKMGIESYIVDDLQTVDVDKQLYYSSHTYNIVKLEGKFYRIDLTGNQFLKGISKLYDQKLPLSASDYQTNKSKTYTFDYQKINGYLQASKNIKTTTTKKQSLTTTKTSSATTKKTNHTYKTTTKGTETATNTIYQPVTGESTTAKTEQNGNSTNPTHSTGVSSNLSTSQLTTQSEEGRNKKEEKEIDYNKSLFTILGIVILLYILYRLRRKF